MKNILSFDIEEHFQVSGLVKAVSRESWDRYESRVEQNTLKVLDILERCKVKATFFVLGWIAERHWKLIEVIAQEKHEIASHGYDHKLIYDISIGQFADDLKKTNELLEAITRQKIIGHRAPSFSLNADDTDKFELLASMGFKYDSSLFPMKHFRYGKATSIPLGPFDIKKDGQTVIKEFPMSVVDFCGRRIPAGGGGYFRFYPNFFLKNNFNKVKADGRPNIIYLHPWEFDPDQPRIRGAELGNTFRHYINLKKTKARLEFILGEFEFGPFRDWLI